MQDEQAQPATGTPALDTSPPGEGLPVPPGEQSLEEDPAQAAEAKAVDSQEPEDVPDTSDLEQGLGSPDQVPPDGDNSQAELKEAPADDAQ
jgi:hypothetical protein